MKRRVFLVLLIIFAMLLVGCSKKEETAKAGAGMGKGGGAVQTAEVTEGKLTEKMNLSGTLEALNCADVVAKSSGKVASLEVDVGSRVTVGQTLMTLEADDLAAAVQSAEANLENAQVTYDLAHSKYQRGKELRQAAAISQADFEENYEGAFRKAAASLKSSQAALAQSQVRYKEAFIKAPLSGIVTARTINVGELAGSATPIFSISNLDQVVVLVNVNEQQVNKFVQGQRVAVKVSAVSPTPFTGAVTNIALAADSKTKAYPIKIQLANADHLLKPGMFAEVLWEGQLEHVLLVPRTAVKNADGQNTVFLLENGVLKERQVILGSADDKNFSILSGLQKGEKVVVGNLDSLREGMKVNTQPKQDASQKKPQGGEGQ